MRGALLLFVGGFALGLGGCKKKATRADCEAMADRSIEFLKSDPTVEPGSNFEPLHKSMVEACLVNGTTPELAHCVATAASSQEAVACHLKAGR